MYTVFMCITNRGKKVLGKKVWVKKSSTYTIYNTTTFKIIILKKFNDYNKLISLPRYIKKTKLLFIQKNIHNNLYYNDFSV